MSKLCKAIYVYIFIMILIFPHKVFAESEQFLSEEQDVIYSIMVAEKKVNPDYYKPTDQPEPSKFVSMGRIIIGFVQSIGSIASVLSLMITGIMYMVQSVEGKAEYKNTLIYYIIGALLVFAISNISALIYKFVTNL